MCGWRTWAKDSVLEAGDPARVGGVSRAAGSMWPTLVPAAGGIPGPLDGLVDGLVAAALGDPFHDTRHLPCFAIPCFWCGVPDPSAGRGCLRERGSLPALVARRASTTGVAHETEKRSDIFPANCVAARISVRTPAPAVANVLAVRAVPVAHRRCVVEADVAPTVRSVAAHDCQHELGDDQRVVSRRRYFRVEAVVGRVATAIRGRALDGQRLGSQVKKHVAVQVSCVHVHRCCAV